MSDSSDGRPALPEMGPRGPAVIDQLLAQVTGLKFREQAGGDFAFWIAARPGMLPCHFCHQAAQVLAEDIRYTSSGRHAVIAAKAADRPSAHFYLCSSCAERDLRHIQQLGRFSFLSQGSCDHLPPL